jgi:hypothetical protein
MILHVTGKAFDVHPADVEEVAAVLQGPAVNWRRSSESATRV